MDYKYNPVPHPDYFGAHPTEEEWKTWCEKLDSLGLVLVDEEERLKTLSDFYRIPKEQFRIPE